MMKNNFYSNETKELIMSYICSTLDLSKFRYKLIENKTDLDIMITHEYSVLKNYHGLNNLLIFMKSKGNFYSFMIDRKSLNFSLNNTNINNVKLFPVRITLEENIYEYTVYDGIYVNTTREYYINDVYFFRGKDMTRDKLSNKFIDLTAYLKTFKPNEILDNITLKINKLYKLSDIEEVKNNIDNDKKIKGLIFQPEFTNKYPKLIFLTERTNLTNLFINKENNKQKIEPPNKQMLFVDNENNLNDVIKNNNNEVNPNDAIKNNNESNKSSDKHASDKNTDIKQTNEIITSNICIDKTKLNDGQILVFSVKNTNVEDVYKLYLIYKSKTGHKTTYKKIKIDIAFVPDIKTSEFCLNIFKNAQHNNDVLIDCKYNKNKNKWVPIQQNTTCEIPSLINPFL